MASVIAALVADVEGCQVALDRGNGGRRIRCPLCLGEVVEASREPCPDAGRSVVLRHHVGDLVTEDGRAVGAQPRVAPGDVGLSFPGLDDDRRVEPAPIPARRKHLVEVDGRRVGRGIAKDAAVEVGRRPNVRVLKSRGEGGWFAGVPRFDEAMDGSGRLLLGQGARGVGEDGKKEQTEDAVNGTVHGERNLHRVKLSRWAASRPPHH